MSLLKPRPYQTECIEAFNDFFREHQRGGSELPTGVGKTFIFSTMADMYLSAAYVDTEWQQQKVGYVAVLVDRDELVKQTVKAMHSVNSDLTIGVVKAERNELLDADGLYNDVVIISIQTIGRKDRKRLEMIPSDHFGLIIVDEAHLAGARSYTDALEYFGAYDHQRGTKVAGFSATLTRIKGGLGDVFERADTRTGAVYQKDILWAIANHYLVDIRGKRITIDNLTDDIRVKGGEYDVDELGAALINHDAGTVAALAIKEHASDRTTIINAPNVASAIKITEDLALAGITAEYVVGSTPIEERQLIFKRVRIGETQVLVNVRVLTLGFDMPQISCVILAGSVMSPILYTQMIGRGTRLWGLHDEHSPYPWIRKPKTDLLVLDIGGSTNRHKLASMVDLTSTPIKEIKEDETLKQAAEREEKEASGSSFIHHGKDSNLHAEDINLFTSSVFAFSRTKKGNIYIPTGDWYIVIYPETTAPDTTYMLGTIWSGKAPARKGKKLGSGLELGYAMAMAEREAEEIDLVGTFARKHASWKRRKEPATDAQKSFAHNLGIVFPDDITKRDLSPMIDYEMASAKLDGWRPKPPTEED
jgi:superfamily II DNA or RNA helicase